MTDGGGQEGEGRVVGGIQYVNCASVMRDRHRTELGMRQLTNHRTNDGSNGESASGDSVSLREPRRAVGNS